MKRTLLSLTIGLASLSSFADHRDATMYNLVGSERLSPQEAASVLAISQAFRLDWSNVVATSRSLRTTAWNLAPAFSISERTHRSVKEIWTEHRRGRDWQELERGGYYNDRRDNGYDNNDRRDNTYDGRDHYANQGNEPNNGRYGYDNSYRSDRNRRYISSDEEYERRVWSQILSRAYGRDSANTMYWIDRRRTYGDLSLAGHVGRLARVSAEDVMQELDHLKNWNRVRECFGISADWDSQQRRVNYSARNRYDRDNNREKLEGLINIVIGRRG